MKSKSFVTEGPFELNESMRYGQILAESYYRTKKNGVYEESHPNTSEILNQWFSPNVDCFEMRGGYVYLKEWNTGLFIERYTGPDGISTERIIFKPTADSGNESVALEALNGVFAERYLNNANNNISNSKINRASNISQNEQSYLKFWVWLIIFAILVIVIQNS